MKKIATCLAFFALVWIGKLNAQTPATGTNVSSSKDVIIGSQSASTIVQSDSTGTPISAGKNDVGPMMSAPASTPASPGTTKANDAKKPD